MTVSGAAEIGRLAFPYRWRHYQEMVLEAFEDDRRHGRASTYVVAPPGSGKTLLGMEMVRRLGTRALVLVPNTAVQQQWLHAASVFGAAPGVAAADAGAPIAVLTYQALCQLDDPAVALGDVAGRRWAAERAKATGSTAAQVAREAAGWTGEAAARRRRELARITASLKREIARAGPGRVRLGDLLSATARKRIEALRAGGAGTLVLDECHHLASLWGYVVRAAVGELGGVHLVGLTATPPDALTADENDLYGALLGPVDFIVPAPALVRDRALAPYQELAWLTRPLDTETAWLTEHDLRFTELVADLHAADGAVTNLPAWVIGRMRDRSRSATEEAAVSWAGFQRRHPALARAGARFLASGGLDLPPGVPRGEGYREPPDLGDWLVLLEDYALHCLAADPSPAAGLRYDAIGAALRSLGFTLTRQGIRRGASDVDRLLMNSTAKTVALVDVVLCEFDARGTALRALVLTDTERGVRTAGPLSGVLRADAGSAPEAVLAIAADSRTAPLRPLLVSGRGLRCAEQDADALLAGLRAAAATDPAGATLGEWRATNPAARAAGPAADGADPPVDGASGLVSLSASGAAWQPRLWVALATAIFTAGQTRLLVGTRALLGEGWDAPCVNCLIDLSAAATAVSVVQSRGRALRLDPADPGKIASNWDIVCVAPELVRGSADYERFVRKHRHLFAPSEDGVIEAGPSHVHPALGPFAPPQDSAFAEINRAMTRRAAGHAEARERWRIGEPYTGAEQKTLVVLPRRTAEARLRPVAEQPPHYQLKETGLATAGWGVAALDLILTAGTGVPGALTGLLAAGALFGLADRRLGQTQDVLAGALPLDLVAHAICDAYRELGELSQDAAASLAIEPRSSGYLRCYLRAATPPESDRFAQALDQAVSPVDFPRYLISRLVPAPGGRGKAVRRLLTGKASYDRRWVAVPDDFGRSKRRAEVYAAAWRRWLGPSELQFTQRSEAGREAVAGAGAQASDYQTSSRQIWV